MKNIQIIDGADNCTYSIYETTDDEFHVIFPGLGQNIEFIEDVAVRLGDDKLAALMLPVWKRPVKKKSANGIHGTLFYGLLWKKQFYPTKKDEEMVVAL